MERGLHPGVCHLMWRARFSVPSFPRDLVSVCIVSSFEISFSSTYDACSDSGFRFSRMGLSWVESVVLRILLWGKIGCLGCFVDSMLQIRNLSNRWVRVFFLGFGVLVHP